MNVQFDKLLSSVSTYYEKYKVACESAREEEIVTVLSRMYSCFSVLYWGTHSMLKVAMCETTLQQVRDAIDRTNQVSKELKKKLPKASKSGGLN